MNYILGGMLIKSDGITSETQFDEKNLISRLSIICRKSSTVELTKGKSNITMFTAIEHQR